MKAQTEADKQETMKAQQAAQGTSRGKTISALLLLIRVESVRLPG